MADTANLKYTITVDGAQQGAVAFQNLAQQMGKTEQAAAKMAKPANDNARAFELLSQRAQRTTTILASVGGALGRLDPAFAAMGASVGRATGAIGAMTSLLSGPWGIAVGLGITALGIFADKAREAEKSVEDLVEDLKKQEAQTYKLAIARERLYPVGGGAVSDAQARERQFDRNLSTRARLAEVVNYGKPITAEQASRDFDAQVKLADEQGQIGPDKETKKAQFTSGEIFNAQLAARLSAAARERSKQNALERGGKVASLSSLSFQDGEIGKENRASLLKQAGSHLDQTFERQGRQIDEMASAYDAMADAGTAAFKDIATEGVKAFAALARGEKGAGKALLQNIGSILIGRGQDAFWQGVIMNSNPFTPGLGTPMIVAGLGAIAAGVAMGAASSAGGGGSGAGSQRPAAPATPNNAVQNTGGGSTTIINLSSVVAPSWQDGVRVQQALDAKKMAAA